ncbi:MAG: DNA methyltransferase [Chloroflexi bacterium]|nr:DNA methyltransferase [Chloroflexota bacterium]
MPKPITRNTLFYGDNLPILREHVPDESVDLIYLDPPFNSNRSYNVLFKDESGQEAEAQIVAFDDTWHWAGAAATYHALLNDAPERVSGMIAALHDFIGPNQMMAYLVMMAARLVELHRVLKPTGSLYLHCDPTASHYLKIVLDAIMGIDNFRNEIIWQRSNPKSHTSANFPNCTDTILRYTKSSKFTYHQPYGEHDPDYVEAAYKYSDEKGRYRLLPLLNPNDDRPNLTYEFLGVTRVWRWTKERMQKGYEEGLVIQLKPGAVPQYKKYLQDSKGRTVTNCWTDILQAAGNEALGYPTQKPVALLERILNASSNPGDVVLDPFCGCGTAVVAAQKLGRRWIGIDITHLSIALQKNRLKDMFGLEPRRDYDVIGEPEDLGAARQLAQDDRYQFQWWALSLIEARPVGEARSAVGGRSSSVGKKGSDRGIDGVILFTDDKTGKPKRALVQVKSGHVTSRDVRDLRGTVEREAAALGIFITLEPPTTEMQTEAASAGIYHSPGWNRDYPRLQIVAIADLLHGSEVKMPPTASTFKQAQKVAPAEADQPGLGV